MGWSSVCKLLQKQSYDFLSHRYGTVVLIVGCILVMVSAFQFGEVALEWSTEKYAAVFNSFSDNVAGKSYRNRLCLPVPIDIVYTWVNGTDTKLLAELRKYKNHAESEINITRADEEEGGCQFAHCIPAYMIVLDPALPKAITPDRLGILYPAFKAASSLYQQSNPLSDENNVTIAVFNNKEEVEAALKTKVMLEGNNVSVGQIYYTSEWTLPNGIMTKDTIIMSGFPHTLTQEELLAKLPDNTRKVIEKFHLNTEKSVAYMTILKREDFEDVLQSGNITIEGKKPQMNAANIVWDLTDYSHNEDVSASRFEDNEELRYSLRSIEQYAPWIRHVYIVTNGQIPGWLNLDNPRLTVVTHTELFKNKSHLPSFSSPAIESHLHEIPGLSDKFLYLNDDVMFGKDVWPDDFFNHAQGQKVYLTWPIPNCQDGCPSTWIRDGYCDKACNNSECEWDGGDCAGGASSNSLGGGGLQGGGWQHSVDTTAYCNSGCANNWIADRYCDQSCNVHACAFDAGDCGVKDFHRMTGLSVSSDQTNYKFPSGELVGYLNVSSFISGDATVEEASYTEEGIVRAVAVAQKFKVVAFVLYDKHNATQINFTLKIKENEAERMHNFTVQVNTNYTKPNVSKSEEKPLEGADDKGTKTNTTKKESEPEDVFIMAEIPQDLQIPKAKSDDKVQASVPPTGNLSDYELPADIKEKFDLLLAQVKTGELTEKGFRKEHAALWAEYQKHLSENSLKPVKAATPQPKEENEQAIAQGNSSKFNESKFDSYLIKKQLKKEQNASAKPVKSEEDRVPRIDPGEIDALKNRMEKKLVQGNDSLVLGQVHILPANDSKNYSVKSHKTRKLNAAIEVEDLVNVDVQERGFLPWEKQNVFSEIRKTREAIGKMKDYEAEAVKGRMLLDTFGDSLRHVNRIYNKAFGYVARKVPAHMPHMIDKHIMAELQDRFRAEWDQTSANRIRASSDMQFAFSYFYYLMGVPKNLTTEEVFDDMDKDHSGVLSDRELRTMATRLYDLPLDLQTLTSLETMITNCSKHLPPDPKQGMYTEEKYYDKNMPLVTKHIVAQCSPLVEQIHKAFKGRTKYKFEISGEDEIAFKMIRTNVSQVVGQLDDVRKNPKKFVCLNDNIDHTHKDAKTVKAVIVDFYEALFPNPSGFELPREYRNRFLHVNELREWRRYRDWLKWWTQIALFFLIMFTVASFFSDKIDAMSKRIVGRRGNSEGSSGTSRRQNIVLDV